MYRVFTTFIVSLLMCILCAPKGARAQQLTPFYDFEKTRPKKAKPQQVLPRFPPQFRSKDTVGGKASPAMAKPTAQVAPNAAAKPAPKPKPAAPKIDTLYKVTSTKIDANGNEIKDIEIIVGNKKFRETYITPNANQLNIKFNIDTLNLDSITVQVVKKNYRMYVYHKHKFLTSYKVVFGPNFMTQKAKEGDRATPEGFFKISERHAHKDWTLFMGINYPTDESYKIFDENKKNGTVKAGDRIGGAIGIHGVWDGADAVVDQRTNWTDGCIAMKRDDLLELSRLLKNGAIIHIRRSADKDFNMKVMK
jgi:L,D-peptidoglycan transpeptidase YkuD (ErfK/YbiS/YcfS/YnhG family)